MQKNNKTTRQIVLDTETTGLSSATGTLVFLIGIAVVSGENLILEQMLLTRIDAEKYMLEWLNKKCFDKTHFISYNGKSFDIPLLENRFRMNRIKSHLCQHHIDLLHWIRRLRKCLIAVYPVLKSIA